MKAGSAVCLDVWSQQIASTALDNRAVLPCVRPGARGPSHEGVMTTSIMMLRMKSDFSFIGVESLLSHPNISGNAAICFYYSYNSHFCIICTHLYSVFSDSEQT